MTSILSLDPGKNSGIILGYYDATTPFRLEERYQVHDGLGGFIEWWSTHLLGIDEIVCERFDLAMNEFKADLTPKEIEGALVVLNRADYGVPIIWQPRTDKSVLTGYPPEARTKAQRQRVRFDFLDRFGFFKPGTEYDDSNDAITHALVSLKRRRHAPSLRAFWRNPTS